MADLLVLVVVLALALTLGQLLFAHLGTIELALVALLGLGAVGWLIDALSSPSSSPGGAFTTPMGTPYQTLRLLTLHGHPPSLSDCRAAEQEARAAHRSGDFRKAKQQLLITRALWSVWRSQQRLSEA